MSTGRTRRDFVRTAGVWGAGLLLTRVTLPGADEKNEGAEDVSPAEDLMREHGVLKRVLLVYGEVVTRLGQPSGDVPPDALADAAGIIQTFIEDYHEKLEENYLFPRFRKAGQLVDLVTTLEAQHQAGRRVTEFIQHSATSGGLKDAATRARLASALQSFVVMYNPHEAREDTVLFPAFRKIVSEHEYDSLGEDFEREEHRRFGEDGFEHMVEKVAGIERRLGIYDLARFTPTM